MTDIPIKIQFVKTLSNLKPSRVIALKADGDADFSLYVTDKSSIPFPLKDNNSGIITAILNTDGNLNVTGTTTKTINVAPELLAIINSALRAGDNISELTNDANYITLTDLPTFVASDYDLEDFTNLSTDPFARQSEITSGITNLNYTPSTTQGTVTSDTGTDATIPLADSINAGLITAAEKVKINNAIQLTDLADVATSGDYNDLSNLPNLIVKENTSNKQNNLTADGTGTKFPTVDAVNQAFSEFDPNQTFPSDTSNTTITVGGVGANTVLANKTPVEILEQMLVVYQNPSFSFFSLNQSQLIEVGVALSGSRIFTWGTSNNGNIQTNSVLIRDVTTNSILGSGLVNDGTETLSIGTIVNTAPITQNWRVEAINTKAVGFASGNYTVNSIYPIFFGKSVLAPTANQALINSGTKQVVDSTGTINITFGASGEYLWFAHPASNTTKTKWYVNALNNGNISSNSDLFNAPTNVNITTVLWSGVLYKIYISNTPTTTSGNMELKNS